MEFIESLQPWHWIILSLVLFSAEALGASGFLIGAAVAALLEGLVLFFLPELSWEIQLGIFAVSAIAFTIIYWRYFREYNQATDQPQLNDRAAQLIGKTVTLEKGTVNGEARIQVGDTFWKVKVEQDLLPGSTAKVVATEGMVLVLKGM